MTDHQLINATSGAVEYYTPEAIIEAARQTMGGIDLDPASSEAANERVKAVRFYTKEQNALGLVWQGDTVWMNHPFGKKETACKPPTGWPCERRIKNPRHVCHDFDYHGNQAWINKLLGEWSLGHFLEACCITYASTSEEWFQPLLHYPQCFLCPRTSYLLPDGTPVHGNTKGSVVTYLGLAVDRFAKAFRPLGHIKVAHKLSHPLLCL